MKIIKTISKLPAAIKYFLFISLSMLNVDIIFYKDLKKNQIKYIKNSIEEALAICQIRTKRFDIKQELYLESFARKSFILKTCLMVCRTIAL